MLSPIDFRIKMIIMTITSGFTGKCEHLKMKYSVWQGLSAQRGRGL